MHVGGAARRRERVRALGARFVVGAAKAIDALATVVLADGQRVTGRRIVVAAGAWAAPLAPPCCSKASAAITRPCRSTASTCRGK